MSRTPLLQGAVFLPWLMTMSLFPADAASVDNTLNVPQSSGLRTIYAWKQIDYAFKSRAERNDAIRTGQFIPENNLPLGIEVFGDRIFLSTPRWKSGVLSSLNWIPRFSQGEISPRLNPFPSQQWHQLTSCDGLTSVFRMRADPCGRLWVLDSGILDMKQRCPPQILIFDLKTDRLVWRYRFPQDHVKDGSLFTNIVLDVRDEKCEDVHAYITDVWRFMLVVYNWREDKSWIVSNPYFQPDPLACRYELHGISFRWTDGIFGLSLSPIDAYGDRTLYFHPMSSFREFSVQTSLLQNETAATSDGSADFFKVLEEPRGYISSHSSASGMDRNGVMFYNLVTRDSVGCWNSKQPYGYRTALQGVVAHDNVTLVFPNDLKVDYEPRQNLWVISNRIHEFLYGKLNPDDYNFRVMTGVTDELVKGTVCDPQYKFDPSLLLQDRSPCVR